MSASKWKPYDAYKKSNGPTGMLPISWSEARFRMLFDTQKGKIPSEIHPDPLPDSIPYVSMEYLREGTGSQHVIPEQGSIIIEEDDLMILWDGSNAGEILKSKYGVLSSTAARISPKNDECRDFDFFSLKSMESSIKSGNTGMGIPHVGGDFLKGLCLPRPGLDEKKKIAQFLNHRTEIIDSGITRLKQKLLILEEKHSSLITQVVTKGLNPDAPMKESELEGVGKIPNHWEISQLRFNASINARIGWRGLKADEYVDVGYAFLSTPDIKSGFPDYSNVNRIEEWRYLESPEIMLEPKDVLLTKDGSTTGTVAYAKDLPEPTTVNSSIAVIRCKQNVEGEFLFMYFSSMIFQYHVDLLLGGMGVPHLFQKDIKKIPILIPPLKEQHEIITKLRKSLSKIDSIRSKLINQIESLKEYRTALISAVVTGKIDVRESV